MADLDELTAGMERVGISESKESEGVVTPQKDEGRGVATPATARLTPARGGGDSDSSGSETDVPPAPPRRAAKKKTARAGTSASGDADADEQGAVFGRIIERYDANKALQVSGFLAVLREENSSSAGALYKRASEGMETGVVTNPVVYATTLPDNLGRLIPQSDLEVYLDKNKYGRVTPLAYMEIRARGALVGDTMFEIDMVNCQPSLLRQWAEKKGIKADALDRYCENREKFLGDVMEHYKVDRDAAKKLFISVGFGGLLRNWAADYGRDGEDDLPFATEYEADMIRLRDAFLEDPESEPFKVHYERRKKDTRKTRKETSVMAVFMQDMEKRCAVSLVKALKARGVDPQAIIFDGVLIANKHRDVFTTEALEEIQAHVHEKTGFWIQLSIKYLPTKVEMPSVLGPRASNSKALATMTFWDMLGHENVIKDSKEIYIFDTSTGMWQPVGRDVTGAAVIRNRIYAIMTEDAHETGRSVGMQFKGGTWRQFNWIDKYNGIFNEMATGANFPQERVRDGFVSNGLLRAIGWFLFKNGAYDATSGTFHPGIEHRYIDEDKDKEIVFVDRIERAFEDRPSEELLTQVNDFMFRTPFTDEQIEEGIGEFKKVVMATAFAGQYKLRKFLFNIGPSSTGKGTVCGLLQDAFGGYVAPLDMKYFLASDKREAAVKLRPLMSKAHKRVTFGNEAPTASGPICSVIMRQFVSGGDVLEGREHYQAERAFVNHCTPLFFMNDAPIFSPSDEALRRRAVVLEQKVEFKDTPDPQNPLEKQARGASLTAWVKSDEVINAAFWVIVLAYEHWASLDEELRYPAVMPESVKTALNTYIDTPEEVVRKRLEAAGFVIIKKGDARFDELNSASPVAWATNASLKQCQPNGMSDAAFGITLRKLTGLKTMARNSVNYRPGVCRDYYVS